MYAMRLARVYNETSARGFVGIPKCFHQFSALHRKEREEGGREDLGILCTEVEGWSSGPHCQKCRAEGKQVHASFLRRPATDYNGAIYCLPVETGPNIG